MTFGEAIAARHAGMEVCGISCVSNMAVGISENPLTHAEVQAAMGAAALVLQYSDTEKALSGSLRKELLWRKQPFSYLSQLF